jgi:hypothetical protein
MRGEALTRSTVPVRTYRGFGTDDIEDNMALKGGKFINTEYNDAARHTSVSYFRSRLRCVLALDVHLHYRAPANSLVRWSLTLCVSPPKRGGLLEILLSSQSRHHRIRSRKACPVESILIVDLSCSLMLLPLTRLVDRISIILDSIFKVGQPFECTIERRAH